MQMRSTLLAGLLMSALAVAPERAVAQEMLAVDGWEGFPMVEYKGGDAAYRKKGFGMLVLTDSTIAFYECITLSCGKTKRGYFEDKGLIWSHPIKSVTDVSSSSQNKGASLTGRVMFGVLATDNNEEYFGFTYETDKTAESPVFKVPKTFSGAMEAKLKFRMKKLGVSVPPL